MLGTYGVVRNAIAESLKALLGLPNLRPSPYPAILAAIALYGAGLDFADALHLALSDGGDAFLTFDSRFASRAGQNGAEPVVELV